MTKAHSKTCKRDYVCIFSFDALTLPLNNKRSILLLKNIQKKYSFNMCTGGGTRYDSLVVNIVESVL